MMDPITKMKVLGLVVVVLMIIMLWATQPPGDDLD